MGFKYNSSQWPLTTGGSISSQGAAHDWRRPYLSLSCLPSAFLHFSSPHALPQCVSCCFFLLLLLFFCYFWCRQSSPFAVFLKFCLFLEVLFLRFKFDLFALAMFTFFCVAWIWPSRLLVGRADAFHVSCFQSTDPWAWRCRVMNIHCSFN